MKHKVLAVVYLIIPIDNRPVMEDSYINLKIQVMKTKQSESRSERAKEEPRDANGRFTSSLKSSAKMGHAGDMSKSQYQTGHKGDNAKNDPKDSQGRFTTKKNKKN